MAAPIRFLSGRNQQQKIGIEGSTDNQKVLEVVGRVGIGTTIFEPTSELEVRGDAIISGILTASNIEVSTGQVNFSQLNVTGVSTFGNTIDANGRIVGAATSNVIPFLYSNLTDLPSAATYHGAFAHVHSTGKAYYAHAGNWIELVNKEVNGTVGTGTERYNIGPVDLTTLDVSGISTFAGAADFNGSVDIDGHTELDDLNVSGVSTFSDDVTVNANITIPTNHNLNMTGGGNLDLTEGGTLKMGSGGDTNLRIYNNGQVSVISDDDSNGSGLLLRSTTGIELKKNGSGNEKLATFTPDGPVDLYYDNVKKFETTSAGIDVTGHTETDTLNVSGVSTFTGAADFNGDVDIDGHTELDNVNVSGVATFQSNAYFGDNDILWFGDGVNPGVVGDLQIKSDGATSYIEERTSALRIYSNDLYLQDYNNAKIYLRAQASGSVELYHNNSKKFETTADGINVSGASTFAGAIDANGGLDVSGGSGLVASSAKISDLTDNRIVIAGASGELEDTSKVTFDGTTLNIVGNATFTGNVSVAGTLTSEDKTNIDSIGIITARTGVRINSGGLVVSSGVSTFTDSVDANGGIEADTAKVSDLTSGRVVTVGTGGELQDNSNLTFDGTTLTANSLAGNGSNITDISLSNVIGAINGITIREEGTIVGSANSTGSVNFVSSNLTASASGVGATITLTDNPSFTNLSATNVSASSSVTGTFHGDGSNIININVDQVVGAVSGITIREEGTIVGSANSVGNINFVSSNLTASASGAGSTITFTNTPTFDTVTVTNNIAANGNIVGDNSTNITGINQVTATTFSGDLSGNATSATTATNVTVGDESSDTTCFPLFVTGATGGLAPKSGTNLTFNSADGTLTATDFNTTSDENLKDNIRTIEDPLTKVVQIRGVNFDWKETQKPSIGVIAQEVEKVFPELVANGEKKTVNYNGLIGLLIEVVKEQQTQINSLNERLSQLE